MSGKPFFAPVPSPAAAYTAQWANRITDALNTAMAKVNNVAELTLLHGATSTPMVDARLSAFTGFSFTPLTANAAAIQSGIYVTNQGKGKATINHANTANTDQNFTVSLHG